MTPYVAGTGCSCLTTAALNPLVPIVGMMTRCRSSLVASTGRRCISKPRPRRGSGARWARSSTGSTARPPDGPAPLPALTRAALGHLWFESIHPFEDGNGRLGRALAEKSLAQNIGQPSLIALAYTIERHRKGYYDQLETHQKTLDITGWLLWFAETVLAAQQVTLTRVAFFIGKAKFYDQFRDLLNDRQAKVIERMFREGPDGFKGGLSAENYIAMTGTSRATTTRDLQNLVEMGALRRTGERRHTRYWLGLQTADTEETRVEAKSGG